MRRPSHQHQSDAEQGPASCHRFARRGAQCRHSCTLVTGSNPVQARRSGHDAEHPRVVDAPRNISAPGPMAVRITSSPNAHPNSIERKITGAPGGARRGAVLSRWRRTPPLMLLLRLARSRPRDRDGRDRNSPTGRRSRRRLAFVFGAFRTIAISASLSRGRERASRSRSIKGGVSSPTRSTAPRRAPPAHRVIFPFIEFGCAFG